MALAFSSDIDVGSTAVGAGFVPRLAMVIERRPKSTPHQIDQNMQ